MGLESCIQIRKNTMIAVSSGDKSTPCGELMNRLNDAELIQIVLISKFR